MKERTPYRSAPSFGDVCQCIYEWSDDQLEELSGRRFRGPALCDLRRPGREHAGTRLEGGGGGRLLMRPLGT